MASKSLPIRLITYNVRFAIESPTPGEEPWSVRCPRLCAQLRFMTAGQDSVFICLQEVLHSQLSDIQTRLGPAWTYIGQGRDDGDEAGEYSPIFFRPDRWECLRNRTYWLSPTPDVPSKGWDAALNRVVTMGLFRDRGSGATIVLMNTHFDHKGEIAREESARLLLKLAETWAGERATRSPLPVSLTGDLNSTPTEEAYKILTAKDSGMKDIADLVPEDTKYGNREITFTSFGNPDEPPSRIDFLFVRDTGSLRFLTFGILPNRFDDKIYLSDHRPVVADVEALAPASM
ncbi:DNase I-like protein [Parathielavia appendiculata]|uniref:DNase I-like protein n=1 Tax=Parathielavia appendiculata TaxID=2587402 RepID=A0AAN6Z7S8_9PEZI|nr:DNase I-like protein [Parathielavia appendiculata]